MEFLRWLPEREDWRARLRAMARAPDGDIWAEAMALANTKLDFVRTNALDAAMRARYPSGPPAGLAVGKERLAILGSSTLAHLHAGIRVAGLRRGIWIDTYESEYGQYWQELLDRESALHAFAPGGVLFAFDARHATQGLHAAQGAEEAASVLAETRALFQRCWDAARREFRCPVMQQTLIDVFARLMGGSEHRLPGSRSHGVASLNASLGDMADASGVDLVGVDAELRRDGLDAWYDPALWHRSKQEIRPTAAPAYGELVARSIAARAGRSYKCLVLDLDNTLWGGVIGDDGLDGIVIGQGSALGEGFVAVQEYARELARRGIILAVSSKNDEANALEPFEKHPDMVLRRADIASFRADWNDKAANIRAIAQELNIGLDALVFLDDNPFERELVRTELPMVAVPEVPEDPALVPAVLADAGYFESLAITAEDRERTAQYQENQAREKLRAHSSDIESYLQGLEMRMIWRRFDRLGQQRIVQLINKTNQFNLTTRRYTEEEVADITADPHAAGLQIRLLDRFGDNGIIAIVILRLRDQSVAEIDTWLMSCRVLGRQVEQTTLNLVAATARDMGATTLRGLYLPTKKNGMVKDHYAKLGFTVVPQAEGGGSEATLDLTRYAAPDTFVHVAEG